MNVLLKKGFYLVLFLSGFIIRAHASADSPADTATWTLDHCIAYARENNIQVRKSALLVDESAVNLKEVKAALFPSLTFTSGQQVAFGRDGDQTTVYTGSYDLTLGMTLFNGGKNLKNISRQKLAVESSAYNYLANANSIELAIIKAYYQVLYSRESVLTNREIVNTSLKQVERSREMYRLGKISKVELLQIESQYSTDEYQLVLASTAEQENLLNLKQILQLDVDYPFQFPFADSGSEDALALVPALNDILQVALSTLPELKGAATDIGIARLDEQMAKAERLPSLSLRGAIGTGTNSASSYNWGKQMDKGLNEAIGVTVNVPILNNRQTKSKVERARIGILNSELTLDNSRTEISNTIASLHLDALSSQSRLQSAQSQLLSAEESYELVKEKFNLGLLNAVDLLVEKNNYLNARQEMIQSKYTSLLDLRLIDFYMTRE